MKRVALFVWALLCLGWGAFSIGGSVTSSTPAEPDYEVAFNTDGSNSTDATSCTGDCDTCIEHGADANTALYDCEYTAGTGEPEGTGTMQATADDPDYITFDNKWTDQAEAWVQFDIKATYDGSFRKAVLVMRDTGANNGYNVRVDGTFDAPCNGACISMDCDGVAGSNHDQLNDGQWQQIRVYFNANNGDGELWVDGTSVDTCNETGSTEISDGFRLNAAVDVASAGWEIDHIQVFLSDPGW